MAHSKRGKTVNRKPLDIKTGDDVVVLSGSGRGKTGKVLSVKPKEGKVIVEGINVMKDRQRNRGGDGRASTIGQTEVVEVPAAIHRSKVALVDPKSKKATRVKYVEGKDGKRSRVSVKSGETI